MAGWPPFLGPRSSFPPSIDAAVEHVWLDPTLSRQVRGRTARVLLDVYIAFIDSPDVTAAAARHLVEDIRARGNHLSTGFVGVGHLTPTLTRAAMGITPGRALNVSAGGIEELRRDMTIHLVSTIDQVLDMALKPATSPPPDAAAPKPATNVGWSSKTPAGARRPPMIYARR